MEEDQISSSSEEFDFAALDDELTSISDGLRRKTKESSGEDSDTVRGVRRRKIRIIESEAESDVENYEEVPSNGQFIPGQNPTATRIVSDLKQPIDFFKLFFTNDLVKKIFWAFLAVVINMGTMSLANLQEYWSRSVVSYIAFYSDTFTRDRFSQIFWMLHLETIPTRKTNPRTRLQRVSCFLDYLNSKFLDYFIPGEHICVDESTIKFKGRISFLTYNPKKPTKWGIRVYALADSKTGYICCILPYYGSLTTEFLVRPDLSVSSRIPIHLYQMLLEKIPGAQGHHMYTDATTPVIS
ncbi:hypothetical protein ACFW04_012437 [Cataglyphis niger]